RRGDGVHRRAIHTAHLHRRHPRRRIEARNLCGQRRSETGRVEPAKRNDPAASLEQRVAKRRVRRSEHGHDADARHAHRRLHAPYVTIASMSVPARRSAMLSTVAAVAACGLVLGTGIAAQKKAAPHAPDVFDELYTRGKKANDAMKTL